MKKLVLPLIISAIIADVFAMTFWTFISDKVYYIGEAVVYFLWTSAFWIRNKYDFTEREKFVTGLLLSAWLPLAANTIQREVRGMTEKDFIDYIAFGISALWVSYKIWRYKKAPQVLTRGGAEKITKQ